MHTIAEPIAQTPEGERATPIAIVGLACRFPDADDPLTLFESALAGRRSFRRLPPGRLGVAAADGPPPRAALLEGWQFSRAEFGVAETAYRAADPAHWLALETAGRALADAGFPAGQGLAGDRAGVLLGNTLTGEVSRAAALRSQWPFVATVPEAALAAGAVPPAGRPGVLRHAAGAFAAPFPEPGPATLAGSQPGAIADRICRHFRFRGGGQAVDAAHSSALLAVATGCALLAAGELDFVLAGGVDISLDSFELSAATTSADSAGPAGSTEPDGGTDPYPGVGRWIRCFAEELRPPSRPEHPVDEEPWRLHATTRQPFGRKAAEVFEDDPAATGVLAVIGDLADPAGSSTLIAAAREATVAGSLVVITAAAGLAGFCASLQAEHPSLGITLIRTADSMAGLLAAQRFAATEPGRFRELVLDAAGAPQQPVMVAIPAPDRTPALDAIPALESTAARPDGGAASQPAGRAAGMRLGRSHVVLVSGGQPGDVLATAHLLAGSGARLALVGGPAKPAEVAAVDLALARLRRAGTVVSYATADISDPDQAEAVVARIEEQTGPVTAVCYPASSGLRAGCTELPADQVRAQISAQADGLSNLLGAISAARLRLLLTVSTLPARYGAPRHSPASLSAAALAEQARRLGQGLPGCRVLHADLPWPPGSGPAAPAELGRLLMNTLAHEAAATRIAIHGRLDAARDADWARVRAGKITVACTVAALDGVPYQVAIALATWPADDEREADGPAEGGHGASQDAGPAMGEPSGRPAGTGGSRGRPGDSLGRPGDTPGRHSAVS